MKNLLKQIIAKAPTQLKSKKAIVAFGVIAGLFIVANLAAYLYFQDRPFPNTRVASQKISGVSSDELHNKLRGLQLLPAEVRITYKDKTTPAKPQQLGISVNYEETASRIMENRSWLPIMNFVIRHESSFATEVNDTVLQKFIDDFSNKNSLKPVSAGIVLKDSIFSIKKHTDGHEPDKESAKATIISSISEGNASVNLQSKTVAAKITVADLKPKIETLNKQQKTSITIVYGTNSRKFTTGEIAGWYDIKGAEVSLSDGKIRASIASVSAGFGILVKNLDEATASAKDAIQKNKGVSITLIKIPRPTRAYSYCVAARGVSTSYLSGLSSKLASVFADGRGWGLGDQVKFTKTGSGCNFTVWLSAASQMPSFGAICDSSWSCRVGANVVINFDRWQNASPAWNASGGSLENYRVMVINHEVGHWFGYGHRGCGGAGQLAPVMQQQSIALQGCKFNPWPTSYELAMHRSSLGL